MRSAIAKLALPVSGQNTRSNAHNMTANIQNSERDDRAARRYPLVSVVIPSYNYGHYVLKAIDSLHCQDYLNIEIIVIDDGSSDNTADLLLSFEGVIYIRQNNQGLSAARNHGIRLAKGKYIQFLDADDLVGTTSIRKRVEYLERNPNKSAVFCRSAYFKQHRYPEPVAFLHREWRQPDADQLDLSMHYSNIAPLHAFLVRKSSVDTASLYFDTELRACEDYDYWLRLARDTGLPGQIRSCWVYYRQHENSMSRSYLSQYRHDAELCRRLLNYGNFYGSWPNVVSRTIADYYAAMLAAALRTARRLWHVDRSSFGDFLRGHVFVVLDRFAATQTEKPVTSSAYLYLSIARLTLRQMKVHDLSVDHKTYCRARDSIAISGSLFLRSLGSRLLISEPYTVIRLLKLDLHYFILSTIASDRVVLFIGGFIQWIRLALNSIYHALTKRQ